MDDEAVLERFAKCPICLGVWDADGDHRVVATKCGHLYGYRCIEDWIHRNRGNGCPQCNKSVTIQDLRVLFPPVVLVARATEHEAPESVPDVGDPEPELVAPIPEPHIGPLFHPPPRHLSANYPFVTDREIDLIRAKYVARMARDTAYTSYQCALFIQVELSAFRGTMNIDPFMDPAYPESKHAEYLDAVRTYRQALIRVDEALTELR